MLLSSNNMLYMLSKRHQWNGIKSVVEETDADDEDEKDGTLRFEGSPHTKKRLVCKEKGRYCGLLLIMKA